MKCGWIAEQDFHWNFRVSCICFFAFPFFPFDWIVLILVRLETSLSPLHKLLDVLVINTDDVTSDTRDMDPHGWIWAVEWRVGECNNTLRCFRLQAHASFLRATYWQAQSRLL